MADRGDGLFANFPSTTNMNIAHGALDHVDYDSLGTEPQQFCDSLHAHPGDEQEETKKNPESLQVNFMKNVKGMYY